MAKLIYVTFFKKIKRKEKKVKEVYGKGTNDVTTLEVDAEERVKQVPVESDKNFHSGKLSELFNNIKKQFPKTKEWDSLKVRGIIYTQEEVKKIMKGKK